mmetsp:Transcript_50337/g.131019  ORF Transcript_50337/g.131019 Transcript_50337/m.131019 type:complete len:775 (-) Transcript_50337:705-3029(-)
MASSTLVSIAATLVRTTIVAYSLYLAVRIRLFAVINYGRVIHEFDPWFNYRATEYMVANGWDAFQAWYDEQSWYPLGRHVGSTTYPGLQLTAWGIHYLGNRFVAPMSVNDVCVFIPAGFGALATAFTGLLCWEATRSANAATAATFFMAVLPAHLMRSVAGGYDNESIAISAIVGTFYFWVRSLRTDGSWPLGVLAGLAYVYMVAAWGGYVFVLNLIGMHAGILVLSGRFSSNLHRAYTCWFVIGTAGAIFGPARYLVGWQPFQSMEQLGPFGVLVGLQLLQLCEKLRRPAMSDQELFELRAKVFGAAAVVAAVGVFTLPDGYIGPLSARIRGLFIKHTKTGNPLVDSVAEHQATPVHVYWQYYHICALIGPAGAAFLSMDRNEAKIFLLLFGFIAAYFSSKMIRLVLILSPAACVNAGAFVGGMIDLTVRAHHDLANAAAEGESKPAAAAVRRDEKLGSGNGSGGQRGGGSANPKKEKGKAAAGSAKEKPPEEINLADELSDLTQLWDQNPDTRRTCGIVTLAVTALIVWLRFLPHCWRLGEQLSEPQIMLRGRDTRGQTVVIDDYREAYHWLRDHTAEDARVMAWWDYGYQINGVGNRTTIADGNTWNHEHIALLGKCLTSDEATSHAITRHLADYVLIWTTRYAGSYSDDLAKSPHMARIGASVYADRIGCEASQFYMDREGKPSECMRSSILYRMHSHRFDPLAPPLEKFEEAYTTTNRMVRIFRVLDVSEESRAWRKAKGVECASQECYPPALEPTLRLKQSFKQIHGL